MERRKQKLEPIRDSLHDLQGKVETLSEEIQVIKKMIEDQKINSSKA